MEAATLLTADLKNGRANDSALATPRPVENGHAAGSESKIPISKNPRRLSLKQVLLAVVALLGLAALVITAHHWWTVGRFNESTDDAYVGGDVTVIAPKVAGFVLKLNVGDNQPVHAGDLLLKLDDRDYLAALARADAAVEIRKSALTNIDANRRLQEAVVSQEEAAITAADAEIVRTHDDQVRFSGLLNSRAVSVQEFQKADADYKEALAMGERARAGLIAAQRQLEVVDTQKQQARAALQQAVAERDLAQLDVNYTELRAPMDGVVGNRSAQVGGYATVGAQLISLVPVRGLWIDANFKESQLARIRPGSPATVKVDSIPGKNFPGHVVSVAPATGAQFSILPPENATGNFTKIVQRVTVRIVLDDETAVLGQLRPGLSVTAKVNTKAEATSERAGL